jgi:hypothetical protein
MKTKEQLNRLLAYFQANRRSGHTTAMMEGAKNSGCLVLARNQNEAGFIKDLGPKGEVIALPAIHLSLTGTNLPLLIDNSAITEILASSLTEISRLESKVESMKELARRILNEADKP